MRRLSSTAHLRRVIGGVLLALLVSQWGALVHAVLHAPLRAVGHTQALGLAPAQADSGAQARAAAADTDDHGKHRANSPVCQLWDHLLLGQAPVGTGVQVHGLNWPTTAPVGSLAPFAPSQAAKAYDARGPPQA